ncbi:MAG: hypothetical protein FWC32_01940 [Firmicutes bacterium]|nr:hypothetical protein [Bacillota bacterium]
MRRKKILSVILALVMVFGSVIPIAALPEHNYEICNVSNILPIGDVTIVSSRFVEDSNLGLTMMESIDEYYRVIRTLVRDDVNPARVVLDIHAEASAILLMMGMNQYFIDGMSCEDLEFIAFSPSISTLASYSRIDQFGNSVYIDRVTAHAIAEEARQAELEMMQFFNNPMGLYGYNIQPFNSGSRHDGVMSLFHLASQNWSNRNSFMFHTDATWLNEPFMRLTDSIGSTAMSITADVTRAWAGGFSYTENIIGPGSITSQRISRNIQPEFRTNGNWNGAGILFSLPRTWSDGWWSVTHRNMMAFSRFYGLLSHTTVHSFNSIGSYYHTSVSLNIRPSLSIGLGRSGVAASIGLSIALRYVIPRHVQLTVLP